MSWPKEVLRLLRRVSAMNIDLKANFVGRDEVVDLMTLATVAQEHLLMVGPPGVAKSALARQFSSRFDGRYFTYQLNAFTEPSALFGPLDVAQFRQGTYAVKSKNMLPEADIAFLDETFQANDAILNALLGLLEERTFLNGSQQQISPLLSVFGASNQIPSSKTLTPFVDRFALRAHLKPVSSSQLDSLLNMGLSLEKQRATRYQQRQQGKEPGNLAILTTEQLRQLSGYVWEVDTSAVQPIYAQLVRELRVSGLSLSDRRVVKGIKLIACAALLDEKDSAELQHLWPLLHIWSTSEERALLRELIEPYLQEAQRQSASSRRGTEVLNSELISLKRRSGTIHSPISASAHLMCLGRLRREALIIQDPHLLEQLEAEIQLGIQKLESLQAG